MPDFSLPWRGDLQLSPSGGVELVDGLLLTEQRLIRRLLTVPGDDIFEPSYGAGLPRYVGKPMHVSAIAGVVQTQALLEETVASVISVTVTNVGVSSFTVTLAYTVTSSPAITQILTLPVS